MTKEQIDKAVELNAQIMALKSECPQLCACYGDNRVHLLEEEFKKTFPEYKKGPFDLEGAEKNTRLYTYVDGVMFFCLSREEADD